MVPISRRRFVAVGGLTAIAGCLARGNESESGDDPEATDDEASSTEELPEDLEAVLNPLPASVDGTPVRQLSSTAPDPESEGRMRLGLISSGNALGLDAEDVDRAATARYGENFQTVAVYVGSFGADQIGDPEDVAVSSENGLAVIATTTSSPWETGLEASEAATDDPDTGVDGEYDLGELFGPVVDADVLHAATDIRPETVPDEADVDAGAIEAVGVGVSRDLEAREETSTYVVVFVDGEEAERGVIEELLRTDNDDVGPGDAEIETNDGRAVATVTRELPRHSLPDNSPNVYATVRHEPLADDTEVGFSAHDGDTVDASNLELLIDGESVDPPWEDDRTIEDGDSFQIDAQSLQFVTVVWNDPELEDVSHPLGRSVVGGNRAFTAEYDAGSRDLTLTFIGDRTVDPDRFVIERSTGNEVPDDPTSLSEHVDELDPRAEFVLEGVEYGDTVRIQLEDDTEFSAQTIFWHSAEPPGAFELTAEDGDRELVYSGSTAVRADEYRVLVDDTPADAQFADVAEELTGGETLDVDVEIGGELTVEYVGTDEPVRVFWTDVQPAAEFSFDVGTDAVQIEHTGGESIQAADLSVHLYPTEPNQRPDAFAAEYDTVETGDSITVEYETGNSESDGDTAELETVAVLFDGHAIAYRALESDGSESEGSGSDRSTEGESGHGEASEEGAMSGRGKASAEGGSGD